MVYTVSSLKNAASFLKKQGLIPKSVAITKLKKPELESLVKNAGYDMTEIKSFKRSKSKTGNKSVGRPRKIPIGPKLPKGMTYKRLVSKYAKEGNPQLEQAIMAQKKKKRGRPAKSQMAVVPVPAQVVAGQRKQRKQRSDKGKKRGPRA